MRRPFRALTAPLAPVLALALALAGGGVPTAGAQQRDFDALPGPGQLRSLLGLDPDAATRNIYRPGTDDSMVARPPAPAQAPPKPPASSASASARPPAPVACASHGARDYVSARITFDLNSATVKPGDLPGIRTLAQVMREHPAETFEVAGHTDISGGEAINLPLSVARARAVARLLAQEGVDASRLRIEGKGSARLCLPDQPYAAANRRVTFARLP